MRPLGRMAEGLIFFVLQEAQGPRAHFPRWNSSMKRASVSTHS